MQISKTQEQYQKDLPSEWKISKLSDVLNKLESGSRDKGGSSTLGIPSIGGEHISRDGRLKLKNMRYISEKYFNSMKNGVIKKNDVLLVKDGATIGKTTIIREMPFEKMAVNEHVFILRGNEILKQEFLFYYLTQRDMQDRLNAIQTGSAQPGINSSFTKHLKILIPPLFEQHKIASILSNVDTLIQKTGQIIEQTQRLKKGLMQRLLTKGIGHTKFKNTVLGEIPECWKIEKLEELCKIERGKFTHRPRNDPKFYGGKYPFIQTGDVDKSDVYIKSHSQTLNDEGTKLSKLFPKDIIVITIAANIGSVAITTFPLYFPDSLVGITPLKIDLHYLFYLLLTKKEYLKNSATKSAQPNINLETLKPLPIAVPSANEQKKIGSILLDVDSLIQKLKDKKKNEEILKKGLMKQLLTGKIRVKV